MEAMMKSRNLTPILLIKKRLWDTEVNNRVEYPAAWGQGSLHLSWWLSRLVEGLIQMIFLLSFARRPSGVWGIFPHWFTPVGIGKGELTGKGTEHGHAINFEHLSLHPIYFVCTFNCLSIEEGPCNSYSSRLFIWLLACFLDRTKRA